jgi:hypothetical protein
VTEEGDIQKRILQYLVARGLNPRRYNNRIYGQTRGLHIPIRLANGKADNGHPDIGVRTRHARIWIECKTPSGAQSDAQKAWQREVEELGEIYVVARSLDDVRVLFEATP